MKGGESMTAEIKLGQGWSVNTGVTQNGHVTLERGQVVDLISPEGEVATAYNHNTGTWVGLKGLGLATGGKVSVKTGMGVNLHTTGSYVQVGEGELPALRIEHIE